MVTEGLNAEVGQVIAGIMFASFLTPDMALFIQCWNNPMPCLASFFDTMFGVKKLVNFIPAINFSTSAFEPSAGIEHNKLQ